MKLKFLLFAVLFAGILNAQEDTIRSLIITEVFMGNPSCNFVEITNMGDNPVQLSNFQIGQTTWSDYRHVSGKVMMLPEYLLQPEESYLIAQVMDYTPKTYAAGIQGDYDFRTPAEFWELANLKIHIGEGGQEDTLRLDSISPVDPLSMWFGRNCIFIEQHFNIGDSALHDSVVVDQVMGVFDGDVDENGNAQNRYLLPDQAWFDVAGYKDASGNARLIRKYAVKTGNLNFADARGVSEDDSEWIALPEVSFYERYRKRHWTLGNHGDFKLDENTLESDVIDIDFANKKLTVPWGLRRPDDIMANLVKKPGISWYYQLSPDSGDSLYYSVRTGDKLDVIVAGEMAYRATFDIVVNDPLPSDNRVVPKLRPGMDYASAIANVEPGWPRVSKNESGNDTITGFGFIYNLGIPYGTRIDTLLSRLEKPDNAAWEVILKDGEKRADLKDGDLLVVTAENGSQKEYYIKMKDMTPKDEARLSSITWPDIPPFYKGLFGWKGDTIPNFAQNAFSYKIQVPLEATGIPALVAKPVDINASVEIKRARNLDGTEEDRTVTFTVWAENDTTFRFYNVQLEREKNPDDLQPFIADPFISEFVHRDQYQNFFYEIFNPGNQPLNLSDYMIARGTGANTAADIIQSVSEPGDWKYRYRKYVPGYKWVDESKWAVSPGMLELDLNVNSMVDPNDVFVIGVIRIDNRSSATLGALENWWVYNNLDVQLMNYDGTYSYRNPWGEEVDNNNGWPGVTDGSGHTVLFKILNDSIKRGLKPANDPNDFQVIDWLGMEDGGKMSAGGVSSNHNRTWQRNPDVYKGNPVPQASFRVDSILGSEWTGITGDYWATLGYSGQQKWLRCTLGIGQHFMNTPSHFMSTVTSVVYKVSPGFVSNPIQRIWGIITNTTVSEFYNNLIKAHEGQTLTVKSFDEGTVRDMDAMLSNNDTLIVLSADSVNTTKYLLEVSGDGLSSDAVLTSERYDIKIDVQPKSAGEDEDFGSGTIRGFDYGTQLKTILANIEVPFGASLNVIDNQGAYVPLLRLNYDTSYVNVTVNSNIFFEVVAENGITTIVYQLLPQTSEDYAFVTSDFFNVKQKEHLIEFVPDGISAGTFLDQLVPSAGATMKLIDKLGYDRTVGSIARDDKLIVTSPSGNVETVYFLSFLPTSTTPLITYLAYVLSDVYMVDQVNNVIAGPTALTLLNEFYSNIRASMGATAVVIDAGGNEKTTGDLNDGDMLKVTSADGKIEVFYALDLDLTFSDLVDSGQINIYPNPTSGRINISGVAQGTRVQVISLMGSIVLDVYVKNIPETISLDNQPSGLYTIILSDKNKLLGRFKAVRY